MGYVRNVRLEICWCGKTNAKGRWWEPTHIITTNGWKWMLAIVGVSWGMTRVEQVMPLLLVRLDGLEIIRKYEESGFVVFSKTI